MVFFFLKKKGTHDTLGLVHYNVRYGGDENYNIWGGGRNGKVVPKIWQVPWKFRKIIIIIIIWWPIVWASVQLIIKKYTQKFHLRSGFFSRVHRLVMLAENIFKRIFRVDNEKTRFENYHRRQKIGDAFVV